MPYVELAPYKSDLKKTCDNAVNFFVLDNPIPSGLILWLQHTSEENQTTDFDAVRIGRGTDENEVHWWESHEDCTVNVIYWMDKPVFFVPEGQRVIFRFDGATVGDLIFCTVDGYLLPKMVSSDVMRFHRMRLQLEESQAKHQESMEELIGECRDLLNSIWERYNKLSLEEALR